MTWMLTFFPFSVLNIIILVHRIAVRAQNISIKIVKACPKDSRKKWKTLEAGYVDGLMSSNNSG